MRVVHISTFDVRGGAAIAAHRLHHALRQNGVDSSMLVLHQSADEADIAAALSSRSGRLFAKIGTALDERTERYIKKKGAGSFSLARFGTGIASHPQVREADIIHLHWLGGGYLSLADLKRLFRLQKPVVWTMHDMWPFTGGCHYSGACAGYTGDCENCPLLRDGFHSMTKARLAKKKKIYAPARLFPVGCSTWLAGVAAQSTAFQGIRVQALPNPIDIDRFAPMDRAEARQALGLSPEGTYLLFGAASPRIKRKGFEYLVEALQRIRGQCELLVYGADTMQGIPDLRIQALGTLDAEGLRRAYSAVDVFVVPSLEDNLPNTIMEAMACATAVAAFDAGGISDMIEHKHTGYLAALRSSEDLAQGIAWCLAHGEEMGANARKKVETQYTYPVVARRYQELYEEALS